MHYIIRPYDEIRDLPDVLDVWRLALGEKWHMRADIFASVTTRHPFYQLGDHFVAEACGEVVAFIGTQVMRFTSELHPTGGISVLFVHPDHQRQGIAHALHEAAMQHLRQCGMCQVELGGGGEFRFWPGVPDNLSASLDFFKMEGWTDFHECCDMVRSLKDFEISPASRQCVEQHGITFRPAISSDVPALLRFIDREFPWWRREFGAKIDDEDYDEIFLGLAQSGSIIAAQRLFTPKSRLLHANTVWKTLLGENLGGLGAVGVAEEWRGRGIGLALVEYGSESLKQRGIATCHIDWLEIADFYAKAGYQVWRTYHCSTQKIAS
jgi:predicted N-acetyltransferase YhbS